MEPGTPDTTIRTLIILELKGGCLGPPLILKPGLISAPDLILKSESEHLSPLNSEGGALD